MQVVGHRGESGRDDAADIIAASIHHVEGDRGSKVHYNGGRSKVMTGGDGVRETIRPDRFRPGIIDSDSGKRGWSQCQRHKLPVVLDVTDNARCCARYDAAQRGAVELCFASKSPDQPGRAAIEPRCRRDVCLPKYTTVVGHAEVRVSVADVEEEKAHFCKVTSPPITRSRRPCCVRRSRAPSSSSASAWP